VRVTLTVPADVAAGARLVLPVWTPGSYVVRDYAKHVQTIAATDERGDAVALHRDGTTAWRLPEEPTGDVEVAWELYANDLSVRTNHVDDHHALLIPAATFLYPDGAEDRPHEVHLPPFPAEHRVFSLLPPGDTPDTYVASDRDHLIDSAFEVGDLPRLDVEVEGVPHTFVWAGHGGAPDLERIGRDLTAIAAASRALFGGPLPTDRYTILCRRVGGRRRRARAPGRGGAPDAHPHLPGPELTARFQSLLAHEYLHLWNVKRLVPEELVHPTYDRPTHCESLWVAEGWTAYYDELVPTRAGLWQPRRLLDTLQATWARTRTPPGCTAEPAPGLLRGVDQALRPGPQRPERDDGLLRPRCAGRLRAGPAAATRRSPRRRPRRRVPPPVAASRAAADGFTESDVLAAIAAVGGDELAALVATASRSPGCPSSTRWSTPSACAGGTRTARCPPPRRPAA
jgi:predicted metalloprotease with PDZ domain